jgi:hypothetical protein
VGWLDDAVAAYGEQCRERLAGPGDREAAIRAPIETLITAAADALGLRAVPHAEVRDPERAVRPDYAIAVNGAITGYVEVKAPGVATDPATFTGHNQAQWERQRDLPNLLYTNGTEWRLWRNGEPVVAPVGLTGGMLDAAGTDLHGPPEFEALLTDFLRWKPASITSVGALVRAVAPLTRLLRSEVLDQLAAEHAAVRAGAQEWDQPFTGLATDWRAMLFPTASDEVFADGYAQAVTFALLLARTEGIDVGGSLHDVGDRLGAASHSLMGRALQLLTDTVAAAFQVSLDLMARVIEAVNWPRVRAGRRDTYLHLYEHFLDVYDPELRKLSGSYYTPREVVEPMVRLAEEAVVTRLGKSAGFADPDVVTVDPAMGTGTYLHAIIERIAERIAAREGAGIVPAVVAQLAERLNGFELQMGPYAVAELRTSDLLRDWQAEPPAAGMPLYVTDTLDDPYVEVTRLGYGMEPIARSRRRANAVKSKAQVTVVIGNPPYRERAEGLGGWVEHGDPSASVAPPLDAFRARGNGLAEYVLKNLYVYFWRWATWKVFDAQRQLPDGDVGVVCFISTAGYLRGPGFKGMREYLRRTCSEGWVVDLTPEGQTPDVPTRIFPGVRQPLAIGLFVRRADTDREMPAAIRYRAVEGRQAAKFAALAEVGLDDGGWRPARTGWQASFTPAATSNWDTFPALNDLMPWTVPGVKPNRTWVYAPSPQILERRWRRLVNETDPAEKRRLFKESRDSSLSKKKEPLPADADERSSDPLAGDHGPAPRPVRVGYRSFDRQWLIFDHRLLDQARPPLWRAQLPGHVFLVEQHSKPISDGPGVVFSALIPDMDHFKGSEGGRVLPMLHPGGRPNAAPGLLDALSTLTGSDDSALDTPARRIDEIGGTRLPDSRVEIGDLVAYVAAVVAHPAYTERFADELTTPGIRVPLTADANLWQEAVELGRTVVWAHTYGEEFADPAAGRPAGDIRFPAGDPRRITNLVAVSGMPSTLGYDERERSIALGTGRWGPVDRAVFDYAVGSKNIVKSWFNYRKAVPGGRKSSPLDEMHVDTWPAEWSIELTDLLTVLTRLVEAEPAQADLLDRILAGPLLTMADLADRGVHWPKSPRDRKPRYDR